MPARDWNTAVEIGQRLRLIRQSRQQSLTDVAELCEMSAATLSRIENAKQELSVLTLLQLCEALDCSPHDVLSADEREPHSVLAALRDVQRAKAAFKAAAEHVGNMEKRLQSFSRRSTKRRA